MWPWHPDPMYMNGVTRPIYNGGAIRLRDITDGLVFTMVIGEKQSIYVIWANIKMMMMLDGMTVGIGIQTGSLI